MLERLLNERQMFGRNCLQIASVLTVPMEELLRDVVEARVDFEIFKSNACHLVKDLSDIDYIIETLKSDDVNRYWNKKWYPEAFYTLAMLDYLSSINDIHLW